MMCQECKFYKKHIFFGVDKCENCGSSCEITGQYINCILKNDTAVNRLNANCPLKKGEMKNENKTTSRIGTTNNC